MPLTNDANNQANDRPPIDLGAAQARYRAALSAPTDAVFRTAVMSVMLDVPVLVGELRRLRVQVWTLRLRYADLVAAGRAALLAAAEGEPNPWAYLVDELPAPPPGHPLHRDGHGSPGGGGADE